VVDPAATFTVSTLARDGLTLVVLGGELDLFTTPRLTEALDAVAGGGRRVVLDLRGLEFMDSTGLAVVLRYHQLAQQAGAFDFVVVRGPEAVDRVFRITRTDDLLQMLEVPPES
jgi:anti-sigma B factor antagonist